MISKVELGSVNSKNISPKSGFGMQKREQTSFTGLGDWALRGIQYCEKKPMINVAVLDLATAIIPRTFFETFIGSKQKDENGNEIKERKLNFLAGFEALRREGSGLLINCMIPGAIVVGVAKLLSKPVMGAFHNAGLATSWANSDTIDIVKKFYHESTGKTKDERIFNTLKSMFDSLEGVDGDISKGGLKTFKEIFANDQEYEKALQEMTQNILSKNPENGYTSKLYKYMVGKSGISENIRFIGDKNFISSSLGHLCDSAGELLHGANNVDLIKTTTEELSQGVASFDKYLSKANKLVNAKSLVGLTGIIIPLAIAAQPINRWITHKMAGKKGAPIYNDDKERILTPEENKELISKKFLALPLMWATAGLSMIMDRPSLKMFQFKNIFPTMDQARIISAATFSSRLAASEDSNELVESTIRDIATFSSFYFLGDYAAKGIATYIENHNKDGIKLINRLKEQDPNANVFKRFWTWAKHTKMKSTDELGAIANQALNTKARNLRAVCQLGNLAFSLLSLGVFIPLYTRTQTNKKEKMRLQNVATKTTPTVGETTFTQNYIKNNSKTFNSFLVR